MTVQGRETIFTVEATPVKFGAGAVADAGWELARLGVRRALLVTDAGVAAAGHAERVAAAVAAAGIEVVRYDDVRVEPTLKSLEAACAFAAGAGVDGFVSVGGGSAIDTAKVANLITTHPAPIMAYVNAPIGEGRTPPGPLRPHLAIPTTPGSGSEATTVAVLDLPELGVKSGISHRRLRASQAIVDPELTRTLAPEVVASCGLDVVCHAVESYLARPFDSRSAPTTPGDRPPYQGSNPVADLWSERAVQIGGRMLRRAVADAADVEARGAMMLAATMAGIGFGSAGVHIPHAIAYPVAGLRHDYEPPGYPSDHRFIPHGHSVIVSAPASFRFTYDALPDRHRQLAELLGGDPGLGAEALPQALIELMRDIGAPSGIAALGYGEDDVAAIVAGARKQRRLLEIAPLLPTDKDLAAIVRASLRNW